MINWPVSNNGCLALEAGLTILSLDKVANLHSRENRGRRREHPEKYNGVKKDEK